jgi:hypothetical protein
MEQNMRALFLSMALASTVFGGDPAKDLYGTIESYSKSQTIKVGYEDAEKAKKDCERLGFKVKEDYVKGKFLICEFDPKTIKLKTLIELVSCESVKHVTDSMKRRAID